MSSKRINPEHLSHTMRELLEDYGDAVYDIVEESAKKVAREATSELRRVSPGEYARMWRHRAQKNGKTTYRETVYNAKYHLTHLLEKEHKTGTGSGQYPKNPGSKTDHTGEIAKVEEKAVNDYLTMLEERVGQ